MTRASLINILKPHYKFMRKKIELVIKILIGATFFVPLIMAPSRFIFPFIVPKLIVFRSLILLMLGGYLLLLATAWNEYRPRRTLISLAVGAFFASLFLSTVLSVDAYRSIWDNHERMLGVFTLIHYGLYYLIATSVVREWRDWKWLARIFLFAGTIVMFIAFLQQLKPDMLLNQSGNRSAATLGNPIYVGGYGLFLSFLGWFLSMKEEKHWWQMFASMGGIFGILGIFFSGTRGALLGFLVGVFVLGVVYLFNLKEHTAFRRNVIIAFACLAAVLGALYAFRRAPFVERIPTLGVLLNTSLRYGTASTRIMAWEVALEGWRDKPWFGWGFNNFYLAFNKFYRPQFLEHGWGETWFDNAHNIIVNTLAAQGAVGLFTYLGMFGAAIFALWRARARGEVDVHIAAAGLGFFVAHLVQNVFVFENPTSYLYFFFMLAFANASADPAPATASVASQKISLGLAGAVGAVILLAIYSTNINPARANQSSLKMLRSLYGLTDPIGTFERTAAIPSPHIDDIRNDFARTAVVVAPEYEKNGYREQAKEVLKLARDELAKNRALHPLDIRVHLQQSQVFEYLAMLEQNGAYLLESESALEDAMKLSPKRQQLRYMLAAVKFSLNKKDEAIGIMRETLDMDPKVAEGWWRLALMQRESGRAEEAKATVRKARELGVGFDDKGIQITNEILPPGETSLGTKK